MSVAPPIPPLPETWNPKVVASVLETMQRRIQELQAQPVPAPPPESAKPSIARSLLLLGA